MLTHKSVPFGHFLHEYLFGSSRKVLKTIKCVWILKETNVPILPIGNPIFAIMTFRQSCLKILFERPLCLQFYSITSTFHPHLSVAQIHRSIILFQAYQSSSSSDMLSIWLSAKCKLFGVLALPVNSLKWGWSMYSSYWYTRMECQLYLPNRRPNGFLPKFWLRYTLSRLTVLF